jgi:transposase
LQASLTGGNPNDVTQLMPVIQDIPPVRGRRGRPRRRPDTVYADRAYDHDKYRKQVRAVGVTPVIARRGTEHGSGLGQYRWVVEQTFALLHWFRRLRIRWGDPRRHPRGIPSPGVRHDLPPRLTSLSPLLGVHLPGFRGRIDRMLGRSPGECRKGQHAPTWRKAADDQLAAYTDVPADQKHQAVEPVAVCTSGSLTSGSKDDAEAPKATGRVGAVSRAGQG